MLRRATAIAVLTVIAGIPAAALAAAPAHWVYNEGYVWLEAGGQHCLKLRTSITADSAGADKTQADNGAKEDVNYPYYQCTVGLQWWVDPSIQPGTDSVYTELDWALTPGLG